MCIIMLEILCECLLSRFSHVQLFVTQWTAACQASLSMGFSRQEYQSGLSCPSPACLPYWSGFPCLSPGGLPYPRIELTSIRPLALSGRFFTTNTTWKALINGNYLSSVFMWSEARERKRLHQLRCFFLFLQGNQSYSIQFSSLQLLSLVQLCKHMDCSPPGSSVHRILQARILGWAAMPFSKGSSQPRA